MTTTPTIWKTPFLANAGATAGGQTVPRTIALANGNFLVVWEDNTNGPGPFIDVMGRMFNAEGTALGVPFQLNSAVVASDETGPEIVAMPDGGYVVAYGSYLEALGGFIGLERFDANGLSVSSRFITDPVSSLTEWKLTVDSLGNYTIVYERWEPHAIGGGNVVYSQDIFSRTYDYLTNGAGPENSHVAQNSAEVDELGAVATFANGHMVTFYNEPDYDFFGNKADTVEYSIIDPVSGTQIRNPVEIDGPNWDDDAIALDVACLSYGPFVLLYQFNDNYAFRIGESDAPGSPMSSRNTVATFGALGGARVVALNEGGFFIEWLESTAHILYGQRYAATGAPIGTLLIISTNVSSIGQSDMSLTTDGRILVPFKDLSGEINEVILDPRENTIYGTDSSDQLTTQTTSSFIYGLDGDDFIYGQNGSDRLDGGLGLDTLSGGNGNDTFILSDANRFTSYAYDTVIEFANGGFDTVQVMSFFRSDKSSIIPYSYILPDNVEEGRVAGVDIFQLFGNSSDNILIGNSAANLLSGGAGSDIITGGAGGDALDGGSNTVSGDTLNYASSLLGVSINLATNTAQGGDAEGDIISNFENVSGSSQGDQLVGDGGANVLRGGPGNDLFVGGLGADTMLGGTDIDVVDYSAFAIGVNVSLTLGTGPDGDVISEIENITGSAFGDVLTGNNGANTMRGGAGNDFMVAGNGADLMIGGADNDEVSYETATTGVFVNLITGTGANGGVLQQIENIRGSAFGDVLQGDNGANTIRGLVGNDYIIAGNGADLIIGGADNDTVSYETATTGVFANLATGVGANGGVLQEIENLTGSAFGDVLMGSVTGNTLKGGAGNDFIVGNNGSDALFGGADNDTFRFETAVFGNDVIADFQDNADKISFGNAVATSFGQLNFLNNGTTNVTVQIIGQSIVVQGVANITLAASDFLFV